MTPQEFKAWFDGFTEALAGVPTKAQWARIKERVGEIDGKPITERIYLDRYWPLYNQQPPYWARYQSYGALSAAGTSLQQAGNAGLASGGQYQNAVNALNQSAVFNSAHAMTQLGQADALALKKKAA